MLTKNSISYPKKVGKVRNGSYSKFNIVITVNATAMLRVCPVPIYTEKITADRI